MLLRSPVLLATSQAKIRTDSGYELVRFLIDQGSELSFVTEELVKHLKLTRRSASIPLLGIGGTYSGRTRGVVDLRLHSLYNSTDDCAIQAYILPQLSRQLPTFTTTTNFWPHIANLQLADPDFGRPGPIQLLIGSDFYGKIIRPDLRRGEVGSPITQLTVFGWVLSGPVKEPNELTTVTGYNCSIDHDLHELLTRFWTQEEVLSTQEESLTPEEASCESHFKSTHSRDNTGRYIVRLPLKAPVTSLGDSKRTALRCLSRLRQRFASDPIYHQRYSAFIDEYKALGHLTIVPTPEIESSTVYYLPHHGIVREHSETTKLRVVFNGSSKTNTGISLNDILLTGPKLQSDIADVLLWIRIHRFIFVTDIVKMYRQIQLHHEDWNLQRIFWYDSTQQPVSYQLTTVTYGLNCAPYLALRTIQQLIEDEGQRFPLAISALTRGRYVDDIFGGAETILETQKIIEQLIKITTAGGFPLQKWHSNCPAVLEHLPNIACNTAPSVEMEPSQTKLLGLNWQPDADRFQFTVWPSFNRAITKRTALSEIAQLYDPLGFLSPVIIRVKIFIQEMWLSKISWDDPLPPHLHERWHLFRQDLPCMGKLTIPRWINISSTARIIELHGFSDASLLAMAAVVFIRVVDQNEHVSVTLVQAKTKVAPLKRLTIPRLELTAALLLTRLTLRVQHVLDLSDKPVFLWTDSSLVLTWLSAHPSRWKDYVRNRVTTIQEVMPNATWRFVPGKENPADCASRGLRAEQLSQYTLWWNGPDWLQQLPSHWPRAEFHSAPESDIEERPSNLFSVSTAPKYWNLLNKYSSLNRLLRITSICMRAVNCFRRHASSSTWNPISPSELQSSSLFWAKTVQKAWFSHELKLLNEGGLLPKSNSLIRLTPFVDKYGVLRVGGRIQNSLLDPETKHPIILPRHSPLTNLIIQDAHLKTLHGGTQLTMAYLRRTYWIIGGRAPVRSFILRCVRCARYRKVRAQQLMGQLPSPRVTPSRPFLNTGVDYAGPITIKTWRGRSARTYKGYLVIFVCLSTSAVHLELVTNYTTDAFIAAYKRFTGRRGICAAMFSDCGTNLVGAHSELRKLFDSASKEAVQIATILANDGTTWTFNPPSAPHFGGKWEAAVKSTKFHLLRTIGDTILTYEELTTLLTQIEAILNSRPLCPLSDDSEDLTSLTPGHFLIGEALTVIPEPNLLQEPSNRLTKWQLIRQKVEHFWARWSGEFLQRHQAISKWHHPNNHIRVGCMVLVIDERYPPAKWPLARVLELHPGPDGLTRVVTVRTSTSILKRPIAKLSILPINQEETSSAT